MNSLFKFIIRNITLCLSSLYYSNYNRDKLLWVFGEWYGERCCDNCMYLVNFITKAYPKIKTVWITKEGTDTSSLDPSVLIVERDKQDALAYLKKASAIFVVHGRIDLTDYNIMYESGAITVNLWHGIPWKKIGTDIFRNRLKLLYHNYWLSRYSPRYFLATSNEFAKIVSKAYFKTNEEIIKAGYPRNSIFYKQETCLDIKRRLLNVLLKKEYEKTSSLRIITYMPTFRDKTKKVFSFGDLLDNQQLEGILCKHNAIIVEKSHFVTSHRQKGSLISSNKRVFFVQDLISQELLAATDLLITDYSSCFFDYLILDRPIIHYLYDYDYYANDDRGLYYPKDEVVCGDVVKTIEELLIAIDENLLYQDKHVMLRKKRRKKFLEYETCNSCDEIVSKVSNLIQERK